MERKRIDFEQGWGIIQMGITKLKNNVEGQLKMPLSSEEYLRLYETVYDMITQKPWYDYSNRLYDKYRESCKEYITSTRSDQSRMSLFIKGFRKVWDISPIPYEWEISQIPYIS